MNDYMKLFLQGPLRGVLTWEQLDDLWEAVRGNASHGWYVYAVGEPPPSAPLPPGELSRAIEEIDGILRKEHPHEHCGLAYADDRGDPSYIKVYHPKRIGGCGIGNGPPLPGWTLSVLPPVDVTAVPASPARSGFWRRLFKSA